MCALLPYGKGKYSCLLRNHACLVPIWKTQQLFMLTAEPCVPRSNMEKQQLFIWTAEPCVPRSHGNNNSYSCSLRNHVCFDPIWRKRLSFMCSAEPCVPCSHLEETTAIHVYCGTMCAFFPCGGDTSYSCLLRNHVLLVPILKNELQLFMFAAEPCMNRSHIAQ